MLTLPPELQALFVLLLVDATTAGRLAQASRHCKKLLEQQLAALHEDRRLAQQARKKARRQSASAKPSSSCLRKPTAGPFTTARHMQWLWELGCGGTPCGCRLRSEHGSVRVTTRMWHHLQGYHPAEYTALKMKMQLL